VTVWQVYTIARSSGCGTSLARWVAAPSAPGRLWQAERRVVGRHDDVGVAGQADPATQAEALHAAITGHRALVNGGERGETPLARAQDPLIPGSRCIP